MIYPSVVQSVVVQCVARPAGRLTGDVLSCVADRGPSRLSAVVVTRAAADYDDDRQLEEAASGQPQCQSVNAVTRSRVSPGARLAT